MIHHRDKASIKGINTLGEVEVEAKIIIMLVGSSRNININRIVSHYLESLQKEAIIIL